MTGMVFRTVFVLCTIAVVLGGFINPDKTLKRERRRITTPPPVFDCKTQAKSLETYYKGTSKCCNVTFPDFFSSKEIDKCKKNLTAFSPDDKFINKYQLYTLQETTKNNIINFTSDAVNKTLGVPACMAECLFNNSGLLMSNGSVNATQLTIYVQNITTAIWDPIVADAITECTPTIIDPPIPCNYTVVNKTVKKVCNAFPLAYLQCIYYKVIGDCPVANEPVPNKQNANVIKTCAEGTTAQDNCDTIFTTTTTTAAPSA